MENTLIDEFKRYIELKENRKGIDEINQLSPTAALPLMINENPELRLDAMKKLDVNDDNSVEVTNSILNELEINSNNISTLKFVFHELIGNIYDHSNFKNSLIMGKEYPKYYEFTFIDDGIGIPNSLKTCHHYFNNDCEAIINAINGLSTKNELGYIERGTGLNNTANIVTSGSKGEFLIVSESGLVYINQTWTITEHIPENHIAGTLVSLRMNLDEKIDMYKYLKQVNYEVII